jgi:hypothetical protein
MPRGGGNCEVGPVHAAWDRPDQAPRRRERPRGESGKQHGRAAVARAPMKKTRLPVRRRASRAQRSIHGRVPVLPSAPPGSCRAAGRPQGAGERSPDPCDPPKGWARKPESTMPEVSRKSSGTPQMPAKRRIRRARHRVGPAPRTLCERIATSRAIGASIGVSRTRERGERASQSFESPVELRARVPEWASSGLPRQTPGLPAGRFRIPPGAPGACRGAARAYRPTASVNVPPRAASSSMSGAGRKRSPFSARSAVSRASTRASPSASAWRSGPPRKGGKPAP